MPKYVERHFLEATKLVGLKVEPRADGLWRIEHVLADLRSDRLDAVRRLGKSDDSYRKVTFHKEHLEQDQHVDAILLGPGHTLYAAVDERLNETLSGIVGEVAVYVDALTETPYRLHFFEMAIRGHKTTGETDTLFAELIAVREDPRAPSAERFSIVPADILIDLPAHPSPPEEVARIDSTPACDFLRSTYQMEARGRCQQEREHYVNVCRDYLERSFDARVRAAQDRVMSLRLREAASPEFALARQRAENDLVDLQRTRKERMEGLERLRLARHGPVRYIATALVCPPVAEAANLIGEEIPPDLRLRSEKAAEDLVIAYEEGRTWVCERVGHLKIGFDVRSLGPADPQTGYRDPTTGIRRIEVKGRIRGQAIRLTTNEWYKAVQLGDTYWLYVVWDPLGQNPEMIRIQNPAAKLDHVKREIVAARFYDIPAEAIDACSRD
jgi:hypothetical protein